jgi:hypothetical protein
VPNRPIEQRHDARWSVVWTRGEGCEELARVLAAGDPVLAEGDLRDVCIRVRADAIVQRKLTSFDLVDSIAANRFDRTGMASVVAAVGGGPHSLLAARVAQRIAAACGVPGSIVSASRTSDEDLASRRHLDSIGAQVPNLSKRLERVSSAGELVSTLGEGALLVLGAPGGSWLQRQFFGPGRQLIHAAPGGIVVVRGSPRRCFQVAEPAIVIGPWLPVAEAASLAETTVVPVAVDGKLVGLYRVASSSPADATVEDVMEEPLFLEADDPVESADELRSFFDGGPIPVVDSHGRLVGTA